MRVKALRGVCIGVDEHLVKDEIRDDLNDALVTFLVSIGAVEKFEPPPGPPAPVEDEPKPEVHGRKSRQKEQ
jgi:hypothetical protein